MKTKNNSKLKEAKASVFQLDDEGWAICVNNETILSTYGTPFKSKESAEGGIRYYLSKNDPRFYVKDCALALDAEINTIKDTPNAITKASLSTDYLPPATAERPVAMTTDECEKVVKAYQHITDRFNHSQLSALSALLFRYEQDWALKKQIDKITYMNESYKMRTAWKNGTRESHH